MDILELPAINQRIKEIISDQTKGNVTAFSLELGYTSAQKVNRLFKIDSRTEKYPVPSSTIITDISNRFDINMDWIVSGTGNKYKTKKDEVTQLTIGGVMMVPLVNQYAHAGYMAGYADAVYIDSLPKIPWVVDHEYKGKYISFEVRGDSMDDGLKHSYEQGDIFTLQRNIPGILEMQVTYKYLGRFRNSTQNRRHCCKADYQSRRGKRDYNLSLIQPDL